MAYSFHQLSNDFEYGIIHKTDPDYEVKRYNQDLLDHFFVGADLLALSLGLLLMDINWL